MNNEETPPPPGGTEAQVAAAKRALVEYLTGESSDADIASPVRLLLEKSPETLPLLYERLHGDDDLAVAAAEAACWEVREALDEYLDAGDAAAELMPEVAGHLSLCGLCQEQFESARAATREQGDEWLAFAASLCGAPGDALVLTRSAGWVWSKVGQGLVRLLGLEDVDLGYAVGGLRLIPVPAFARSFGLPDDIKPPRSFLRDLPDEVGRLLIHVIPKYNVTVHKESWQLVFELDPGPILKSLEVGLGNKQKATEGIFALSPERPRAEINIEPPSGPVYWLHLAWKTAGAADWREANLHLPFYYDPHAQRP
jgi:hypothetical protein